MSEKGDLSETIKFGVRTSLKDNSESDFGLLTKSGEEDVILVEIESLAERCVSFDVDFVEDRCNGEKDEFLRFS